MRRYLNSDTFRVLLLLGLFSTVFALLAMLGGCDFQRYVKPATIAEQQLAMAVTTGFKALDDYDDALIAEWVKRVEGGEDPRNVQAEFELYRQHRTKAQKALNSAAETVEAIHKALSAVKAGAMQPWQLATYLPLVADALASLQKALSEAGVKGLSLGGK